MTVQVNARIPDEVGAELDRWAAELGIERAALLRDIIAESVAAWREGRARFERPEVPGPADLQRLVTKWNEQATELDRVLRQSAKRDAELARQARADTQGVSEARDAIAADVVAAMRAALEAVHGELVRTREDLAMLIARSRQSLVDSVENFGNTLVESLAEAQQLKDMDAKMDRIEKVAAEPRRQTIIRIGGGDATLGYWAFKNLGLALVGAVVLGSLFKAVPAIGVPVGQGLAGGGKAAFCNIAESRYDLRSCKLTDGGVTITMTAVRAMDAQ